MALTSDSPASVAGSRRLSLALGQIVGGQYLKIIGLTEAGATVSIAPVAGDFGEFGGEVIQYARGDEGLAGAPINGTTPEIGQDLSTFIIGLGADASGQHLLFSDSTVRPGRSRSLRRRRFDGTTNRNGGFGYSGRSDTEIFISYWRHFSADAYAISDGNLKQYYVFSDGISGDGRTQLPQPILHVPSGEPDWFIGTNIGAGTDPNIKNDKGWQAGTGSNTDDVWQRWDSRIKLNTADVADGAIDVWINGVLGISDHTYMWQGGMQQAATKFHEFRLGHMDTDIPNAVTDYTDYYVATTQARVEIGNAPTWSECTHTEILPVPEGSWTDGLIKDLVLDPGALLSLSGRYLYVIKSSGEPFNESGEPL